MAIEKGTPKNPKSATRNNWTDAFCPEGSCPRAWHPTEGHLLVWRLFQSALSGSLFFILPALAEVVIQTNEKEGRKWNLRP
jgi:hypothetical protein